MQDTTSRPLCLQGETGPEAFARYETMLQTLVQLSRLAYCDTGITYEVLPKLGGPAEEMNAALTQSEKAHATESRQLLPTAYGIERPMKTYQLKAADPNDKGPLRGLYLATPEDVTCLMVRPPPVSIFQPTDLLVAFKGSSAVENFIQDLKSQVLPIELAPVFATLGFQAPPAGARVPKSFLNPMLRAWQTIRNAIDVFKPSRLFLTGHSLGGAHATLLAFLLAESGIRNIHLVTFGAPTLLSDGARNAFNRHLLSGAVTLDRVVVRNFDNRVLRTLAGVATLAQGGGDPIPSLPAGFSHPGFQPLATELMSDPKRPTTLRDVRKLYTGGAFFTGAQKKEYAEMTKTQMPNVVGVGSGFPPFPHAEYLGVRFLGALRTVGRKNPARQSIAWFELVSSGVRITYRPFTRGGRRRTYRLRRARERHQSSRGSRCGGRQW